MPSHSVSIRSIEREKYKVMDHQEKEIEEIEESKAFFQVAFFFISFASKATLFGTMFFQAFFVVASLKMFEVLWTLFFIISVSFLSLFFHFSIYHLVLIKTLIQVYEGAVYLNQGKTYLVTSLDLSRKIAWCEEAKLSYYTKTRDRTDIHVVGGNVVCQALNICSLVHSVPFQNLYMYMDDGPICHSLDTD